MPSRVGRRLTWYWSAVSLVVVLGVLSSGCGYALAGRGSFLPDYIETIGVPMFGNQTPYFEVDQVVTEYVRTEFIGRGNYRVVPNENGADAVLEGDIVSMSIAPASFTAEQQASRYIFSMTANIVFRDLRADEVIWQNGSMTFQDEYEVASGGGALDPSTFFGQEANAMERIAEDFAATVVSSILEAF